MEEIKPEPKKTGKAPEVGDVVNYVPHQDHKFDYVVRNGSTELPWVMGLKTVKNGKESVEELSGIRLTHVLEANRKGQIKAPNALVTVRPNIVLKATVVKVYPPDKDSPDGHVDLDVDTERGCVLHYGEGRGTERINVDHLAHDAHCCHACDEHNELKAPDGLPLDRGDKDSLATIAALNQRVAELKKQLADKGTSSEDMPPPEEDKY